MQTNRYHRQTLLPQIGQAGQERLAQSLVLLVGAGALGSVIADQLARAGVGHLRLADRDWVEATNLQRQVLYDEADAEARLPKAVAAAQRLSRVNSTARVDPLVVDVHAGNIEQLAGLETGGRKVDLILDGTDNVETRYLVNDLAVKASIPWVYGACVGTEGRVMLVRPGGPCLRCLFPAPPQPGELATCDTAGVLGPVASVIASMQALAAIQCLVGKASDVPSQLLVFDGWNWRFHSIDLAGAKRPDCPACGQHHYEFLNARAADHNLTLCGRNAVQIQGAGASFDLHAVASRLAAVGQIKQTRYFLRCQLPEELELTIFPDGRTIIQGTSDPKRARSVYARYVGT